MANEVGSAQLANLRCVETANCSLKKYCPGAIGHAQVAWNSTSWRVTTPCAAVVERSQSTFEESGCLGMQPKTGGKLHLKLNTGTKPIANNYREGKVKRTLKRELKST